MNETAEFMRTNPSTLIYTEALIEGVACSIADVEGILHGRSSSAVDGYGTDAIIGLSHAWEFLFNNYETYPDSSAYAQYNYLVRELIEPESAGTVRTEPISISGCHYVAPAPYEGLFEDIVETSDSTYSDRSSQALMMLFLLCKKQIFDDGNKRCAQIAVNHWLAHIDAGFAVCVPDSATDYFHNLLCRFYDDKVTVEDITWDAEGFIWCI